jgi:hypothetical protein
MPTAARLVIVKLAEMLLLGRSQLGIDTLAMDVRVRQAIVQPILVGGTLLLLFCCRAFRPVC